MLLIIKQFTVLVNIILAFHKTLSVISFIHIDQLWSPSSVVIQPTAVTVNAVPIVNKDSEHMECRWCQHRVDTLVKYQTNWYAWLMCIIIFLSGGFLGCCIIPFFVKSGKDAVHRCPACDRILAKKSRKSRT
jgi:hypothetical protein